MAAVKEDAMKAFRSRRVMVATAVALALTPLSACGGSPQNAGSTAGSTGTDPSSFTILTANENKALPATLDALAKGACSAENAALPIEHQKVAQADVVQKVTLLAGQGALPAHFIAGTAMVRPDGDLGKGGLVLDYMDALEKLGVADQLLPAAAATVENVYGGMVSLPYQYNIEGIWYNKQIFAANGIQEPKTWDELTAANAKLAQAGVMPMTEAGKSGWPLTRLMGMYIFRNVGPDAMKDVRDGKAKLTDPKYVAGAKALADLASSGALGEGFSTRDADTSTNLFLTGKAAMTYDGSWLLSSINDPKRNTIGDTNIGFMAFPAVEGGSGSIDQFAANAGAVMAMSPKQFGPKVGEWLKCISKNYGAQALKDSGTISGFKVNEDVKELPVMTSQIQEKITGLKDPVLWFEALLDPKSNSLASTNVSLLTTGQMSAEDYMSALQKSVDAAR